ncbi:TIL domain containing protein [Asbolus verrucosus]|uniref:TIL domain containing protein n=1 Tax=Asbolus verrucosus TaxID=1661398 RepID=A0A482VDB2_ASBVE|nr:TIL domain containing protein [Asbolus verrucosus]
MQAPIFYFLLVVAASVGGTPSPTCEENEEFTTCGTFCPATCQISYVDVCPEMCVSGCFCKEGYVREHLGGKCITLDECQGACRDNEEFKECGVTCPPSCLQPIPSCTNNCCMKGCFCKEGYVLESDSQECVEENECPVYD